MLRYLGYVGISLASEASSNRGTILRRADPERLRALTAANLAGLRALLEHNIAHGVRMFRISSQVIPFASHPVNDLRWWEEFAAELTELGAIVRTGLVRVSMHPGQYTLLSSPDENITAAAVADLVWHARLLDAMGMGTECKLVIHGGGAYGDKPAAMSRFRERYEALPEEVRRRIVIESDERVYSFSEVVELSGMTGAPVVVDTLHYRLNPGTVPSLGEALAIAFPTWRDRDGPPKLHFSTQAPGARPGAHDDYADPDEFIQFLSVAPDVPFDVMLETKGKDVSLYRLRAELLARGITGLYEPRPNLPDAPLQMTAKDAATYSKRKVGVKGA